MINLLPPEAKQAIKFGRLNVVLLQYVFISIITVMMVVSLLMFGRASLISTKDDIEKQLESDRAQTTQLAPISAEAEELSKTINVIDRLLEKEIRFSILLREIGSLIPSGASLSGLILVEDQSEPVSLAVLVDSAEKAGVLQENLIQSDLFISADILTVTRSSDPEAQYAFSANIQAYYNPELPLSAIDDQAPEEVNQ